MIMREHTPTVYTRLSGLLRLFRFELPFSAGVCVVLGELLALGELPGIKQVVLGFLSVFFISATSLILNDYFDIETDRVNAPGRPLPAGLVTKRDVLILSAVVTLAGLWSSALIGLLALMVALLAWLVGFLYNWRFKKAGLWGNLMVSSSVGMTFIFGAITVGEPAQITVWFFAILAFLINLGEEIAADAMDIEGDRLAGSRSLPMILGHEKAMKVSAAVFFSVVLISWLPFLTGWLDWAYALPIGFMDAVLVYMTVRLLDSKRPNRRMYIRGIYLSATLAIFIVIVMRLIF